MPFLRILAFATLAFGFISLKPEMFPPRDFVEYWSAAKVLADGGNPYDGVELLKVQRAVENHSKDQAVSLWTPPWTLPLYLPFGFLPFALAHKFWLLVQLLCFGAAAEMLGTLLLPSPRRGRGVGGEGVSLDDSPSPPTPLPPRERGARAILPYLALLLFSPVFWNLHFGQNTAFILLGLAGFLRFRESRPMIAGAFVALTAIKPHLLAVFGIVLILDAIRPSGRRALLAGVAVLAVGSVIAIAYDSRIFDRFAEAARQKESTRETVSLMEWNVPVMGYHLRQAVNPDWHFLQFMPCLIACALAGSYYVRRRAHWEWHVELPRLVVVSLLVAPYGGWIFDLTLLIVPLVAGAEMVMRSDALLAKAVYFAGLFVVSMFGLMIHGLANSWWFTPAFAGLYLFAELSRSGRIRSLDR